MFSVWSSKAFQEWKLCLLLPALCLCDIWIVPNTFWVFVFKLRVQGWSENKVWIMVFLSKAMWYCVELKNLLSYISPLPVWRADWCWARSSLYLVLGRGRAFQCCWQSFSNIQDWRLNLGKFNLAIKCHLQAWWNIRSFGAWRWIHH